MYYDKFDVRSKEEAYWLYQKDYGTPYTINYFAQTSSYFMKDDHDYRYNDADPQSNRAVNTIRIEGPNGCLLYTSPSPRDVEESRMPSSA